MFPDLGELIIDAPLYDAMQSSCFLNPHADMPQEERRTRPSISYQIDFTYLRALRPTDRGVLNTLANIPSDHYPVWVDLTDL